MRKLATIRKIDTISPIENADKIEVAHIGGWNVVTSKNQYTEGEYVLYFEIDSVIPLNDTRFSFLEARGVKEIEGTPRHILRTAKLRGVYSQGLLAPLAEFPEVTEYLAEHSETPESSAGVIDFSKLLNVFKYEPPLPKGGEQVGVFPSEARKTDSERVQNLSDELLASLDKSEWFATEKIDGTSATFVKTAEGLKVASRNWEVNLDHSLQGAMAKKLRFEEILPVGAIIQGEIYGEGVQGNPLKVQGNKLAIFTHNLYDFAEPEITSEQREGIAALLENNTIPELDWTLPDTIAETVEQVNGMKSTINSKVLAEGVVWWNRNGTPFSEMGDRPNFKAINQKFLLKHGG